MQTVRVRAILTPMTAISQHESARGQSPFELRTDLRIRGGRWVKHRAPSGVEGEGDWRGASRRASASFGEPMGPVWGGAKTHRTLSAHRCGATALCSRTHGFDNSFSVVWYNVRQ